MDAGKKDGRKGENSHGALLSPETVCFTTLWNLSKDFLKEGSVIGRVYTDGLTEAWPVCGRSRPALVCSGRGNCQLAAWKPHARTRQDTNALALGPGCADIPSRAVPQRRACQPLPLVTRPQTEPRKLPQALTETHQVRDASNTTEARAEWPNLPPREKGTREMLPVRVSVGYETCRTYDPNFHFTSWKTKAVKTCSLPIWRLVDSWTTTFQCIRIYA